MKEKVFYLRTFVLFFAFDLAINTTSVGPAIAAAVLLILGSFRKDLAEFLPEKFGSLKADFQSNKTLYKNLPSLVGITYLLSLIFGLTLTLLFPKISLKLEEFVRSSLPDNAILFALLVVFYAPLVEEVFFRHFQFKYLKNYTSAFTAIILTALTFALLHPTNLVGAFVVSIVCTLLVLQTGKLWTAVIFHFLYNVIGTALSLLEGLDKTPLVIPPPEELKVSIAICVVLLAMLAALLYYLHDLKSIWVKVKELLGSNPHQTSTNSARTILEVVIVGVVLLSSITLNFAGINSTIKKKLGVTVTRTNKQIDRVTLEFLTMRAYEKESLYNPTILTTYSCSGKPNDITCTSHQVEVEDHKVLSPEEFAHREKFSYKESKKAMKDPKLKAKFYEEFRAGYNKNWFKNKKRNCLIKIRPKFKTFSFLSLDIENLFKDKTYEKKIDLKMDRSKRVSLSLDLVGRKFKDEFAEKAENLLSFRIESFGDETKAIKYSFDDLDKFNYYEGIETNLKCDYVKIGKSRY